jgi:cell shape-determining protein MreC
MLVLILLLVVGSALVYISKYNFAPVSVNLGFIIFSDVPLFYVIAGALGIGLILSYLVYRIQAISTFFEVRGKNNEIKKNKEEILELTKRIHQLELEKEKIKNGSEDLKPTDQNAL